MLQQLCTSCRACRSQVFHYTLVLSLYGVLNGAAPSLLALSVKGAAE